MKNEDISMDALIKSKLRITEEPGPELMRNIMNGRIKEETYMKNKTVKRSFGLIAVVAAVVILTTTAFAAWYFLKPSDIADRFGDTALSAAFESEGAVNINESITSGGYTYTLLAAVSGKELSDHPVYSNGELHNDRTYAVLAIQKADGSPMPSTMDDDYGDPSFYVSPYVKGEKPWQVNIHTMNGGHSEMVLDGVAYRIIECDTVAVFADRGLYLGINTGVFYDAQAFIYDEQTGALAVNPAYEGSCALFTLPIDASLVNPVD